MKKISPILSTRDSYKPFQYPWAYQLWLMHEQIHWMVKEVPMHEDVRDWNNKLDDEDRNFLTDVFLLFTQSDVDVADGYINDYLPVFKLPEIRMMLLGFAGRETVHIDAYSNLIETLGKNDSFYTEFLNIPVMREKHDFFKKIISSSTKKRKNEHPSAVLPRIAGISAFTEGMLLFSSFVMLLNYAQNNLMKGMGQVVKWSVLDEQLHVTGLTKIFTTIVEENPEWLTPALIEEIQATAEMMAELEFDFIDYVYDRKTNVRGLDRDDLKNYIKWVVNLRLRNLGIAEIFPEVVDNPLPWVESVIGSQNHENFFEARATSYAKAATEGSWTDVWGQYA